MSVARLKYAIGNSSSTSSTGSILGTDTSVTPASTTNFQAAPTPGEGMILMDEGTTSEELAYATGLSSGSLTIPLANRGLEGTAAVGHSGTFTVKGPLTAGMWNDMIQSLTNVFIQSTGALDTTKVADLATAQTLVNKTLTKPIINATNPTAQTYTPSAAGTATLNLSLFNQHFITMPAGNITIALSGATNNQPFIIDIKQDSVGSRTVTWFSGISWTGGTVPTLTTTANKHDTFGFIRTGVNTYQGYVLGQNI